MKSEQTRHFMGRFAALLLSALLLFTMSGCEEILNEVSNQLDSQMQQADAGGNSGKKTSTSQSTSSLEFSVSEIPAYSGELYTVVHDNVPYFSEDELTTEAFEDYSPLDDLGRCGVAMACVGEETMPTEKRGSISEVYPSGWINHPYDFVDGGYLYNRSHLIGYQLTGENANERNLITGTRSMNAEAMLPFENMVADYVKETGGHVLYRVTPVFEGDNLLATGVLMEAESVEDQGESVLYCVFCYNAQPGVTIDYATGENYASDQAAASGTEQTYVLNTGTKKFHLPDCEGANSMKAENRQEYTGTRDRLIEQGYTPCKKCNP